MRWLLDTCAVAEVRRPAPAARLLELINRSADEDLYLSVLTIGEIAKGIELLPHGRKKSDLSRWHTELRSQFADRILPVDEQTAELWGQITAQGQRSGRTLPAADGLIAASALRWGLTVVTRNASHFLATGTLVYDPWARTA